MGKAWVLTTSDDVEIGRIVLDGKKLSFEGCAEVFEVVKLSDSGKPVTTDQPELWFSLAKQLATPPYLNFEALEK